MRAPQTLVMAVLRRRLRQPAPRTHGPLNLGKGFRAPCFATQSLFGAKRKFNGPNKKGSKKRLKNK